MRFWEVDSLRGLALLMMIIFHFVYDLSYFDIADINVSYGFWRYFAYITAFLFVFIAGTSVWISRKRSEIQQEGRLHKGNNQQVQNTGKNPDKEAYNEKYAGKLNINSKIISFFREPINIKFFKRGLFIYSLGILITAATYLIIGRGFIVFGILHLIGISIILSPLFFCLKKYLVLVSTAIIALGVLVQNISGPYFLLFLGIHPADFISVDYEPLLPWLGFFLLGMFAGSVFYPEGKRLFEIKERFNLKFLTVPGRNTLLIYLIHQPVIIMILSLFSGKMLI
ncbi:heparan-alpha-glucosaminide N-acetyltransferase [Methanoplanus limicola]|uniref:heparan-alpha-glucosaminide N-acetyltransferase n=1 Tax=Methanoplanus limicola TaxID=2315 RepID=UPI00145D31FE|nr:heparan-alpha-glucosaminide N-acetyltransferase [Methanoplanus limicola]